MNEPIHLPNERNDILIEILMFFRGICRNLLYKLTPSDYHL